MVSKASAVHVASPANVADVASVASALNAKPADEAGAVESEDNGAAIAADPRKASAEQIMQNLQPSMPNDPASMKRSYSPVQLREDG